ncbi:aspartate 1-decarboxylase [Sinorhizobium medicae]|uniref:aspartate 1-decarboxylase n=1 Tax=Sinorhizobium medicae TaxID=110321 RepID=UPI001F3FD6E7|nr:aspartate 1-decarboxylase [Sinorhizobium medicae]
MTDAKLNYHGSITIDADFCGAVGLKPSGARISTCVLYGDAGSRCCILNGGRRAHPPAGRRDHQSGAS